ncbi:MAG: hypothetical protein EBR86_15065 [Planctomycetia bacterium]|nr:hypothetical protein [Planctomycetia bacterium]
MDDWWQHAVALLIAAAAAAWLIHRAVFARRARPCGGSGAGGTDGFVALETLTASRTGTAKTALLTLSGDRYPPPPNEQPPPPGDRHRRVDPSAGGRPREGRDEGQSGSGAAEPRPGGG